MPTLATRPLGHTEIRVTVMGLGTAPLGGLMGKVSDDDARAAFDAAWEGGVRFFDTAPFYGFGLAERRTGVALRQRTRDDYRLCTKVGRLLIPDDTPPGEQYGWENPLPFRPVYDYGYDGVLRSFEDSLRRLGLRRLDVLLIHDIGEFTHGPGYRTHVDTALADGYRALQALKAEGLVGAIGIGVNETAVLMEALQHGDWDCFLLAGRYTLLEQFALEDLLPACEERGISIICGGPYNSGLLVGGHTWNNAQAPGELIARRDHLTRVCHSHGVPLAAVALQFPLAHPAVACVVPGARSAQEVQANLRHLTVKIPPILWADLQDEGLLRADAPIPHL